MITYHRDENISFEEYHDFLKRTDLGSQYPKERFKERVTKTLKNHSLSISARDDNGTLIGVAFGLTDFAYFLFLTDLGIDREHTKKGIGTELTNRIHEAAGGFADISMVTVSNDEAFGFYESSGFESDNCLFWKACTEWTSHKVE
ncbi:GNAT family N-acetyltransferase [Pelagicoccus sp. SDUM812003]|uniref:GNAT family N-acetyltransferase n=1 Tax=Pelagicoccus sp. SDUM812003 TaxID=3041267 RepID=UPI00280F5916|nr:GNAT family N-acetyltransferase [Pelagicoccus sp. SDUM812003]MDQ8205716.1 GNAT family N-acetyltransferase [Pelagicoccus sp. SDUM812003]